MDAVRWYILSTETIPAIPFIKDFQVILENLDLCIENASRIPFSTVRCVRAPRISLALGEKCSSGEGFTKGR